MNGITIVQRAAFGQGGDGSFVLALMSVGVSNRRRIERLVRRKLHSAGRQFEEAKRAYADAKTATLADLPTDEAGRGKIVCRRHAEKRAVSIDTEGRPECYDPEHPDCRGCVEDIRDGQIETW